MPEDFVSLAIVVLLACWICAVAQLLIKWSSK